MPHRSQIRIVDGASCAVLFLHGITGSPCHFSKVLPMTDLVPDDWSYYNLLLPGHGGTVLDFGKSSMGQWKQKVRDVFLELSAKHRYVVVAGHSMGTLFAIQLATEFPQKIPFLFLIASPIYPRVSLKGMMLCMRAVFGLSRADHPMEMAIVRAGGIHLTRKLWQYIPWAPNMIALLFEAHRTKLALPDLSIKTVVFQSRHDEMVSPLSGRVLERHACVELITLDDSTHFYYPADEASQICDAFAKACEWVKNREVK